jgi:hypothetical protein
MANPNGNPQNLKPFQPGHPGIGGRPRRRPLSEAYDDVLRERLPKEFRDALLRANIRLKPDASWADAIAASMARTALKANVLAAKEMREAVEGKSTQRIELVSGETRQELLVVYATSLEEQQQKESAVLARLNQRELPATTQNIIDAVTNSDEESKEE